MTAIEQIRARQQRAEAAYTQAIEARRAAEDAESAALYAMAVARHDAEDAEQWLCLPKAAREVARNAPELVAAFAAACNYGSAEAGWIKLGWRRSEWWRGEDIYLDTPTGTAARILHRRGREWCDALEAAK